MLTKPKLAMYWASSCGGCEIALVNIHEKILDVDAHFDFMFCPCLLDTKKQAIEELEDGAIAISFLNGAIGTAENEEMAHLLRRKSQLLIAFGSCAVEGCVPGLSNLITLDAHVRAVFVDSPTLDNPAGTVPRTATALPEGELTLPALFPFVKTLAQTVDVDYFIPGCPPEPHQIWTVLEHVIADRELPPKGATLGRGTRTACEECTRTKGDKRIPRLYRTFELTPDPATCLLEQGLVCMGIATADGCGALCPQVNMPCTGCYGPPEGIRDQGAKMVAALGSVLDIGDTQGLSDDQIAARIDALLDAIPDYAGTFYKYSLPGSILGKRAG